jgi:hypothetical protein
LSALGTETLTIKLWKGDDRVVTTPVGWYVRVWFGERESDDPAYDIALYI